MEKEDAVEPGNDFSGVLARSGQFTDEGHLPHLPAHMDKSTYSAPWPTIEMHMPRLENGDTSRALALSRRRGHQSAARDLLPAAPSSSRARTDGCVARVLLQRRRVYRSEAPGGHGHHERGMTQCLTSLIEAMVYSVPKLKSSDVKTILVAKRQRHLRHHGSLTRQLLAIPEFVDASRIAMSLTLLTNHLASVEPEIPDRNLRALLALHVHRHGRIWLPCSPADSDPETQPARRERKKKQRKKSGHQIFS